MKNKNGITLIALIITIIVMLILVAVSVQILVKSDLIGTAESAGAAYKTAHEKEQNLNDVTINGKKLDEYKQKLEGNGDKGNLPTVNAGQRATTNSEYTDGTKTAVIPAGFTVSGLATEKTIAGGLVIYLIPEGTTVDWTDGTAVANAQQTYDQFVWIPINDVNDMYMCQLEGTDTDESGKVEADEYNTCRITVKEIEGKEVAYCTTHNSRLMAGRLYSLGEGEIFNNDLTFQSYDSSLREPEVIPDKFGKNYDGYSIHLDILSEILEPDAEEKEYISIENFKEKLQEEYNEVVKSVYENKGFYVGRYETSNMTFTDGDAVKVVAGADEENNINHIKWYYMYAQQKDYATNNNLTVGSTMIQGAAYDQVIKFVNGTDLGNDVVYDVTESVSTRHTGSVAETGSNSADFVKNIYDLEGNVYTWTTETHNTDGRIARGGDCEYCRSASFRLEVTPDVSSFYSSFGSICQLYVK